MQGLYGGWLLVSARSFCAHYSWLLPVGSRLRAELVLTPWRFARVPDRPEDREIHFGRSLAAAAEYQGDHSRSLAYELPSDAASTGWPVAPGPRIKSSLYPALRGISLYRRIPRAAVSCTSRRADVPGADGPYQHPAARRRLSGHRAVVVIFQDHHVVGLAEFHRVLLRLTAAAVALLAAVALAAKHVSAATALFARPGRDADLQPYRD